jgi:hypothetical protein
MMTWKDRLRPFAEHIEAIHSAINTMSDDDLKKLGIACRQPTQTNCGWSTYGAAKVIKGEVDAELARRDHKRKQSRDREPQ